MGSSHSNPVAVAASAAETSERQQTSTGTTKPGLVAERESSAVSSAQTNVQRTNEECKKRNSCNTEAPPVLNLNSKQSKNSHTTPAAAAAAATTTAPAPSNEMAGPPQIIKSLSSMTNKLVGEAKIMTSALKDSTNSQQGNLDSNTSSRQHVPSALQMCIKGVVKPAHKISSGSQQSAGRNNKRTPAHNHHQHGSGGGRRRLLQEQSHLGTKDSMERRRKSLQDGDVFIYPRLYKDLNECRKCLRDNRICNCNEIELSSDGSSSSSARDQQHTELPKVGGSSSGSYIASADAGNCARSLKPTREAVADTNSHMLPIDNRALHPPTESSCASKTTTKTPTATTAAKTITTKTGYDHDEAAGRRQSGDYGDHHHDGDGQRRRQPVHEISVTMQHPKLIDRPSALTIGVGDSDGLAAHESSTKDANNNIIIESAASQSDSDREAQEQKSISARSTSHSGNESESLSEISSSPRRPLHSESVISSRDYARAGATTTVSTTGQQMSSAGAANGTVAIFANCTIVGDENAPNQACSSSPTRQLSLLLQEAEVKQSPSSVLLVRSQESLASSPARGEAKVTTISIGAPNNSPAGHRWQPEQPFEQLDRADNRFMISESTTSSGCRDKVARTSREPQQSHTSIISIQTRRRNMATKLGCNRAIYEDQDIDEQPGGEAIEDSCKLSAGSTEDPNTSHGIAVAAASSHCLDKGRQLLISEPITIRDSLSPVCQDSSGLGGGGVLDYSPILSSVRDYIKNMNTELQVQTSVASSCQLADTNLISCTVAGGSNLDSSVVRRAITATDLLVASPSTVPCSLTSNNKTLALESPIQVVTSTASGIVQTTFTTALPAASIKAHVQTASACVSAVSSEVVDSSPKKSIFDGASKDEILEYLEDARERVPEILMAADDVMVISENELIVVNQLEPDSPATPISIVETNEVISTVDGESSDTIGMDGANFSPLLCSSGSVSVQHHSSLSHPDQLRQHLERMYQTSQLAAAAVAATSAEEPAQANNSPESIYNVVAKAPGSTQSTQTADLCSSPSLARDADANRTKYCSETGIDSPDFRSADKDQGLEVDGSRDIPDNNRKAGGKSLVHQKQQISPTCSTRNENISTAMVSQCGPIAGLLNFAGPIYAGRRNSVSESVSQPTISREDAMQILALQKRYTNRNSLSSPSSSPLSSTSPSSTSSSNQTSGNCSAATSFYASSSLSCSSPLLNLNGAFSSSNSPAFNQSVPLAPLTHPLIGGELNCIAGATANMTLKLEGGLNLRAQSQQDSMTGQLSSSNRATPDMADSTSRELSLTSPDKLTSVSAFVLNKVYQVDRDDSGIGSDGTVAASNRFRSMTISGEQAAPRDNSTLAERQVVINSGKLGGYTAARSSSETGHLIASIRGDTPISIAKLSRIDETGYCTQKPSVISTSNSKYAPKTGSSNGGVGSSARFSSQPSNSQSNIGIGNSRHYNTLNRLNNYFMNRHPFCSSSDSTVEFQCLDCDQFIDVDQATIMNKTNELRLLRATDSKGRLESSQPGGDGREMTAEQLDRAYVAAMNGLPLCKTCEKKRIERKEIISEFVETELKYGRDLKIMHDEFYRPMQVAGLLSKEQINGVFLNLEELIMAHCKFADRLETAIREAHLIGDTDFNTVNIGGLFLESADMLNTFESYCIRQGAAAYLLARLAKERELLRIFLRVSQMENTLLRRMNLAAFLMVPVQRVTKYPLLLNRLYKVTAYHHKDREALRDAQLKVELHLEHINQQTKGIGASNKIWRRISSLSAPISNRRGLMNAEDIGYIKLRKTALDMLKWDRDEAQFIHSGKIHFAPLTEYLTRQKMKPLRYMPSHALLIVLGRPNWKYRPDLVKATLDSKLMTPTPGGNGIREAALLLFREKNGRFVPCKEPLLLSNCVFSADCSQFNNECPPNQPNIMRQNNQPINNSGPSQPHHQQQHQHQQLQHNNITVNRKSCSSASELCNINDMSHKSEGKHGELSTGGSQTGSIDSTSIRSMSPKDHDSRTSSLGGDIALISSLRGLIEQDGVSHISTGSGGSPPSVAAAHTSRSHSLASALPRTTLTTTNSAVILSKPILSTASSNLTILNQLMTKVNSYHNRQSASSNHHAKQGATISADHQSSKKRSLSPSSNVDLVNNATNNASAAAASTMAVVAVVSPSSNNALATDLSQPAQQQQHHNHHNQQQQGRPVAGSRTSSSGSGNSNGSSSNGRASGATSDGGGGGGGGGAGQPNYNSYHNFHYSHHQPYGDYEESFELHERVAKESMLLRADTPLKTRYWLQMLRYHAKDLGQWRSRRNGLPNIMMMRHE